MGGFVAWKFSSKVAQDSADELRLYQAQSAAIACVPDAATEVFARTIAPRAPGQSVLERRFSDSLQAPHQWSHFAAGLGFAGSRVVYIGERMSGRGNRRIVVVFAGIGGGTVGVSQDKSALIMVSLAFTPGTLIQRAVPLTAGESATGILVPKDGVTQIFAGQSDPQDQSHFTIRFVNGSVTDEVDGWLQDDDTILLVPQLLETRNVQ
ncbi:hypothetical protein [Humisphaera borealis]|uniref:Uncharacterized protein n=1 Tax=Humisphaera borealis TaxID=2807512 RepID=A0A7M2WXF8_9BACT|nr:hypothetical protein [Humisphaera borealis]QOV89882.1 hypothetical protein IPV69_00460 [Humisphaera borealis]